MKRTSRIKSASGGPGTPTARNHPRQDGTSTLPAAAANKALYVLIIVLACFIVYGNTLRNGFVYDDMTQVLKNEWIRDFRHLPEIFSKNVWGFMPGENVSNYYRPMMHILYLISYTIFGLRPWGFHLVNVLFHTLNSILVYLLASALFARRSPGTTPAATPSFFAPPLIAALLFAVHPINTEAVAWVGAVTDLSYSFFCLSSVLFYIRSGDSISNREYYVSVVLFSLALLCKEPAATLPAILFTFDIAFNRRREIYSSARRYAAYILVLGVYSIVRYLALGGFAPVKASRHLTIYQYCINIFPLVSTYLQKLILPSGLNAFHTLKPAISIREANAVVSLLITALFAGSAIIAYRKNRIIFFGLAMIILPLLPALYTPAIGESPLAERYLYLPSAGYVIALAALYSYGQETSRLRIAVLATGLAIIGIFAVSAMARNRIWKNNISLYTDTISKSPTAELPRGNFGIALLDEGKPDEAIEQFQAILSRINPDSENAYYNMGRAYMKKGMFSEAIAAFQKAVSLAPNDSDAFRNLALCYARTGRTDQLAAAYASRLKIRPDTPAALVLAGNDLEKNGHAEEALALYKKAVAMNGQDFAARYSLGSACLTTGRVDSAVEHLSIAARLRPDDPNVRNRLGVAYGQKGLYDKAIEQLETAVRLAPDVPSFRNNLDHARQLRRAGDKISDKQKD